MMSSFEIIEATDSDFEWMLKEDSPIHRGLRLPPGGVDERPVIEHVRTISANLRKHSCHATWMIVSKHEVVGLCGFHQPPSLQGQVEIGYNVTPSRRRQGHATRAVAAIIVAARRDENIQRIYASTPIENVASQRVLERNGFARVGERSDPQDGVLFLWQIDTSNGDAT